MIIHPPAVEHDSQLQLRLCRWALWASLVREVHSNRYLALGLKVLSSGCSVVTSFGNLIDSPPAPRVGVENGPPQKAGPTKKHETVHWDR